MHRTEAFSDERISLIERIGGKCFSRLVNQEAENIVAYIISLDYSPGDFEENISENPCANCPKKCWRLKENRPLNEEEIEKIKEMIEEKITMETADDLVSEVIAQDYGNDHYCY